MRASWQHYGTYDESAYPDLWDGVVGCWAPCLGPTGTRLHDVSRGNNWGTLTNMDAGTDWVVSGGKYALDFDGSNDLVATPTIQLNSSPVVSWSGWINIRAVPPETSIIFEHSTNYNSSNAFLISITNTTLQILMSRTGSLFPANYCGNSFTREADNTWQHLACVISRPLAPAVSAVRAWINGVERTGTQPFAGMGVMPGGFDNHPCFIGARSEGLFAGNIQLDSVAMYNRGLSPNEIRSLYNLGRGGMLERRRRRRVYSVQADVVRSYLFVNRGQVIGGGTL